MFTEEQVQQMVAEAESRNRRPTTKVMKRPAGANSERVLLPVDHEGGDDDNEGDEGITHDQIRHVGSILQVEVPQEAIDDGSWFDHIHSTCEYELLQKTVAKNGLGRKVRDRQTGVKKLIRWLLEDEQWEP